MTFLTPNRMTLLINGVFCVLALFFIAIALGAIFAPDPGALPAWLGAPIGILGAIVLFGVAALAPRRSTNIAFDETYKHDWLRAQAVGYWGFVFAFAIAGNLVALDVLPVGRSFLACSMGAASIPFLYFLGIRWAAR